MTLAQRVAAFRRAYAKWPASWPRIVRETDHEVMYGVWLIGNDYRNRSRYYGAYPNGYLPRVHALFPDVEPGHQVMHVFSGSLPKGDYVRCDSVQDAELQCSVYDLERETPSRFRLVIADPPYSDADAFKYNTVMIDRGKALAAIAPVTRPGGHLVWLDTCWPMHRKDQWRTVGRILLQRSTNHRARVVSIFERVA